MPHPLDEAPWEARIVERRDRPEDRPGRPRAFLARMTSSKSRTDGSVADLVSRVCMNSLNAVIFSVSKYSFKALEALGAREVVVVVNAYPAYPAASWCIPVGHMAGS